MLTGTVKSFEGNKGKGIFTPDGGRAELMVDIKALDRAGLGNLTRGQTLKFNVETDRYGRSFAISHMPA